MKLLQCLLLASTLLVISSVLPAGQSESSSSESKSSESTIESYFRQQLKAHEKIVDQNYDAAVNGNAESQWNLAINYLENGIELDQGISNPGLHWLTLAAKNNHPYAQEEMGYGYLYGAYGLTVDYEKAEHWLQPGVKRQSESAVYNLAMLKRILATSDSDDVQVNKLLLQASNLGMMEGKFELAARLLEGVGGAPNPVLSKKYYDELNANGFGPNDFMDSVDPSLGIGTIVRDFEVSPERLPEFLHALAYMVAVIAVNGDTEGHNAIELPYKNDQSFLIGPSQILTWMKNTSNIAARIGSPHAQTTLYRRSHENNDKAAIEYWRKRIETNPQDIANYQFAAGTKAYMKTLGAPYGVSFPF